MYNHDSNSYLEACDVTTDNIRDFVEAMMLHFFKQPLMSETTEKIEQMLQKHPKMVRLAAVMLSIHLTEIAIKHVGILDVVKIEARACEGRELTDDEARKEVLVKIAALRLPVLNSFLPPDEAEEGENENDDTIDSSTLH